MMEIKDYVIAAAAAAGVGTGGVSLVEDNSMEARLAVAEVSIVHLEEMAKETKEDQKKRLERIEDKLDQLIQQQGR